MHSPILVPVVGRRLSPVAVKTATKPATATTPAITPEAVDEHGLAALLMISVETAGRLMRSGEIPSLKIGRLRRVRVEAVREYLRRQEAAAMKPP